MGKLMNFEFRKLFTSKYFYILLGIALGFILIVNLGQFAINSYAGGIASGLLNAYTTTKGALATSFTTILGIFVAIFATADFSNDTIKNIISKGYNKTKVYFSKYLVSLIATFMMMFGAYLVAFAFGALAFGFTTTIDESIVAVFIGQILSMIAYHAIYFALSYSLRKSGAAIALCIIGPLTIRIILGLLDMLFVDKGISFSPYWVDGIFNNFAGQLTNSDLYLGSFIALPLYIVAAIGAGYLINFKREIH